jgi:ADP-heptose:LPS heptosyltransferase
MSYDLLHHPHKIRKIALLRANALGDFIFSLPAIHALRKRFINAELVYLGNKWHLDFLNHRSDIADRVITIPKSHGMPHETDRPLNPHEVDIFFNKMTEEKFDLALQFHGGGRNSNPFIKRIKAKFTAGFRTPDAEELDLNIPYILHQNEVLRYLEVTRALGIKTSHIIPSLKVTELDQEELRLYLPELQEPYVVINPGSSEVRRTWPLERFVLVAKKISSYGYHVYTTGSSVERSLGEAVNTFLGERATNACGISLNAMVALLSRASLVLSNDTGPLHIARALNTPNVGIFWCANMIMAGPLATSINRTCVDMNPFCPSCGMDCSRQNLPPSWCHHEGSFVKRVEISEVLKESFDLLGIGK